MCKTAQHRKCVQKEKSAKRDGAYTFFTTFRIVSIKIEVLKHFPYKGEIIMACRYYNSSPGTNGYCSKKYEQMNRESRGLNIAKREGELTASEKSGCKCDQQHYDEHCPYLNSTYKFNGCNFYRDKPGLYGSCVQKEALIRQEAGRGVQYEKDRILEYEEFRCYQCSNPSFSRNCPYRNGTIPSPSPINGNNNGSSNSTEGGRSGSGSGAEVVGASILASMGGPIKFVVGILVIIGIIQGTFLYVGESLGLIKPVFHYTITDADELREDERLNAIRLHSNENSREYTAKSKDGTSVKKTVRGGTYDLYLELEGEEIMFGNRDVHASYHKFTLNLDEFDKNVEYKIDASYLKALSGYFEILQIDNASENMINKNDFVISGGNCLGITCIPYGDDGCFIINLWGPESYRQDLVVSIFGFKDIPLSLDFSEKRVHTDRITVAKE